jgi:hypothetical protein
MKTRTQAPQRRTSDDRWPIAALVLAALAAAPEAATAGAGPVLKTEHFDRDPGWEGHNNRVVPKRVAKVTQDFGYSPTHRAGEAKGELGGVIQRSTTPAYYAAPIAARTLDEPLAASGSFAITASHPGAGVFFGFFNANQPGGSGRPIGSFGLDFDFEGGGGRLAVRLITASNRSCGTFITPYLPGKYRPTPLRNDGTRYHWSVDYDPGAAGGNGSFRFTIRSDTHPAGPIDPGLSEPAREEARRRFPHTTSFQVDLPPGFKQQGTVFDRFGMHNMMKAGGTATLYFDDLRFDGQAQDFSGDPGWIGLGNRTTFDDRELTGAHDFGFSPTTSFAGGSPGEIGGGLWRSGDFGFYADRVGPLGLDDRLEARGKVRLVTAGPDSDMFLGWFSSTAQERSPADEGAGPFVGVHVGGPTRVGHYFLPVLVTQGGTRARVDQGPVLTPGKVFDWSLVYDPEANAGRGELRVTLGDTSVTLALKPGQRARGATLDRFGLFTSTVGGQMVKIYLDDLTYTSGR